jgi:hypothetical protein
MLTWGGVRGQVSLRMVNVTWANLDPLAFIVNFFNHFWIGSVLTCSFCETIIGPLSVANTAVSSTGFAVLHSVEIESSAVCSRYYNSPRTRHHTFPMRSPIYIDIGWHN